MASGTVRLAELGYLTADEAERIAGTLERAGDERWMMTPTVLELIARRPPA
jgi:hypothetical protein